MACQTLRDSNLDSSGDTNSSETDDSKKLQLCYWIIQNILRNITFSVKKEEFITMFKNLSYFHKQYNIVNNLHDKLSNYIYTSVNLQVNKVITENEIKQKFRILENIELDETRRSVTLWRPSHNVNEDVQSCIMEEKLKFKENLVKMILEKENIVNQLKYDVNVARKKETEINACIDLATEKIDSIYRNINRFSLQCFSE